MKIEQILSQHRRDFTALYKCEHCEATHIGSGYDDANFHNNVVPNMQCEKCGERAGEAYLPLTPMYPEGMQI